MPFTRGQRPGGTHIKYLFVCKPSWLTGSASLRQKLAGGGSGAKAAYASRRWEVGVALRRPKLAGGGRFGVALASRKWEVGGGSG